jgi:hypothetical protein
LFCFVFFVLCLSVSLLFFTRFHFKFEDRERYYCTVCILCLRSRNFLFSRVNFKHDWSIFKIIPIPCLLSEFALHDDEAR